MGEGEAHEPPSPEGGILRPKNFPSYVGASWRLYRLAGFRLLRPFLVVGVLLAGATTVLAVAGAEMDSDSLLQVVSYAQLLALPFFASLLAGRTALVMARKLAGEDISSPTMAAELKEVRSHSVAAAMVAALIAFAFMIILSAVLAGLGPSVAIHLILGPPVLAQVITIEKRPLQDAWARTKAVGQGQVGRLFLYLFCVALLLVMVELLIGGALLALFARFTSDFGVGVANVVLGVVMSSLGLSFMAAMGLVAYFDLRSKSDDDFEISDLKEEPEEA